VEPRGTDGLKINAWSCYADLSTFWAVVESHIAQMQLSDIRRLRIEGGPLGKDHLAAMSFAWGKSCAKRDPEAFVRAYRSTKASEVLAPSLAASRLVPFSIDYFYPAKPSSKGTHIIRHPACRLGLLPPLIIYRQEHDN
jgi:hypothetical protein